MGFFEKLRERADVYIGRKDKTAYYKRLGIGATIAALKEMMVGEPIGGNIAHENEGPGCNWSSFVTEGGDEWCLGLGDIGTDGEQVYVLVVRKEQDDIPGANVQVCTEAEEEAGQGV